MDDLRLRKMAEDLEEQIRKGQPARNDARAMTVGRLVASGKFPIPLDRLPKIRIDSAQERDAEQLLSREMLELHEYKFIGGELVGPSSPPGGKPGDEPAQNDQGASAGQSGSGGGTVSPGEARVLIGEIQDIETWRTEMRRFDIWEQAQDRRALFFGRYLLAEVVLSKPPMRAWVQKQVEEGGDPGEIRLWLDEELRADYTPAQLGVRF